MDESTCMIDGCAEPTFIRKRQLCSRHYHRARSAGRLTDVTARRHAILNPDPDSAVGDCIRCGPKVRVVTRHGRAICWRGERATSLKNRHGLDHDAQLDMLDAQDGKCLICSVAFGVGEPYCIDHDHACCPGSKSCGKCARGMLCRRCNVGIGMLGDNPTLVASALAYLTKTPTYKKS